MEEYFTEHTGCAIFVMIAIFILCPLTIPVAIFLFTYYMIKNERIKSQILEQKRNEKYYKSLKKNKKKNEEDELAE